MVELHTNDNLDLKVRVKTDTRVEVLDYLVNLEGLLLKSISTGLDLEQSGKFYKLTAADTRQILFASTRARGGVAVCVRNMLLENVVRLDKKSGFASFISTLTSIKMIKKRDLPEKKCVVCSLPFKWRKKWRNNWENVIYCSKRCRRKKISLK